MTSNVRPILWMNRGRYAVAGVLSSMVLGMSLLSLPAAHSQPSQQDRSDATAPVFDFTAPVEDINFVSEEIEGGAQVEEAKDYEILRLSADVNFAKDSAKLSTRANTILSDASAKWKELGVTSIEITGHTDSVKGRVDNDKLSRDRAASVEKVLAKKFPDAKISSTGKGPDEPRADEEELDGRELERARALNRRVEVVVSFPRAD